MTWLLQGLLVLATLVGMAVIFLHARSIAFLVPLLCIAAVAVYLVRAHRAIRTAHASTPMPGERSPDQTRALARTAALFVGGVVAVSVVFWAIDRAIEKVHPPVEEHRAELVSAAVKASDCPATQLNIVVESPKRVRVEGCGTARHFLWGRQRRGEAMHWRPFDPSCTVDYLGIKLSCD